MFANLLFRIGDRKRDNSSAGRCATRHFIRRRLLRMERLEGRVCLNGDYLFLADWGADAVRRYDGVTGALIDTFVSERSGGLDDAAFLTFTKTDPVTLAYMGGSRVADVASPEPVNDILSQGQVQSILAQALPYWQNRGVDTLHLRSIDLRIDGLPRHLLGKDFGNTIRIDANAAGYGGSIQAPAEAKRTDLLSAPTHEVEHLLGFYHRDDPTVIVERLQIALRPVSEIDFQDVLGSLHQPLGVRATS